MKPSILPFNASSLELDLEQVMARLEDVPVEILKLWQPDNCPVDLLPWLAWALSVDEWDINWSEETKRAVVKEAVYIHRHKGTAAAVKRALRLAHAEDAKLTEWFEPGGSGIPRTFWLTLPSEHSVLTSPLGQETLLKLVYAAKPVSAHLATIIEAWLSVDTNYGHHWMPSHAHYHELATKYDHKEFFNVYLPANEMPLAGDLTDCVQVPYLVLPKTVVSEPELSILTLNQTFILPKESHGKIVRPAPIDGEIEPGQLKLTTGLPVVRNLQIGRGEVVQIHSIMFRTLTGVTGSNIYLFGSNVPLRQPKQGWIIKHIEGETEPGVYRVNTALDAVNHLAIQVGHFKQESLTLRCHGEEGIAVDTLVLNHLARRVQGGPKIVKWIPIPLEYIVPGGVKIDSEVEKANYQYRLLNRLEKQSSPTVKVTASKLLTSDFITPYGVALQERIVYRGTVQEEMTIGQIVTNTSPRQIRENVFNVLAKPLPWGVARNQIYAGEVRSDELEVWKEHSHSVFVKHFQHQVGRGFNIDDGITTAALTVGKSEATTGGVITSSQLPFSQIANLAIGQDNRLPEEVVTCTGTDVVPTVKTFAINVPLRKLWGVRTLLHDPPTDPDVEIKPNELIGTFPTPITERLSTFTKGLTQRSMNQNRLNLSLHCRVLGVIYAG